tara:strand:+ start:1683 stop:2186 length:504 start_codon:yes stop_codon:yes gene_type:complete
MNQRRKLPLFVIGATLTYLTSVVAIQVAWPDSLILPEEFPEKCPDESLNCSMIGPSSHRSEGLVELRFNSSLDEVMSESKNWIDSQPRTEIIGEWPNQSHSVFTTLFLRFNDDFVINGFCDDGEAVIHVFSSSRQGISDLGVNQDRVASFARHMSDVEMATSECVTG